MARTRKLAPRGDTRQEAEMHAEAMCGYWRELGYQIEVEVAPVAGAHRVVCWGGRIITPLDARGWPSGACAMTQEQLYRWRWRKRKSGELALPERYGELFRVICRGERNSCLIGFLSDGWRVRNALRKVPADA